jgi:Transposase Tn5 dimerisation domain
LLDLREHARREPEAPAEQSGLSEVELEVLEVKTGRKLNTIRDVVLAVGRLGGHLNRKRDGLPGWMTLWRGWLQLQALVEGVLLAHKLKRFG